MAHFLPLVRFHTRIHTCSMWHLFCETKVRGHWKLWLKWSHESCRPFSQSQSHALVTNKFLEFQHFYYWMLTTFLVGKLICYLFVISSFLNCQFILILLMKAIGKKLIIFLFLGLLHILSCHPFMSHSTQLQSSLLKKQVYAFPQRSCFLNPLDFLHTSGLFPICVHASLNVVLKLGRVLHLRFL